MNKNQKLLEQINQIIKNTITGKIIIFNLIVFTIILLLKVYNQTFILPVLLPLELSFVVTEITLANYFFYQIPQTITPWTILATFWHADIFHFLINTYVLFILGPIIERISWQRIFIKLIIFSMVFSIVGVFFFSNAPVVGFSWVIMGMLAFAYFKYDNIPGLDRNMLLFFLILNIWIWLHPWISLVWHTSWAIGWYVYFRLLSKVDR